MQKALPRFPPLIFSFLGERGGFQLVFASFEVGGVGWTGQGDRGELEEGVG